MPSSLEVRRRKRQSSRGRYEGHRHNAKKAGVEFLLTFGEWWGIWERSGHWEQRGCRSHEYVMARYGDEGPYAVGNVRIITAYENHAEVEFSEETRALWSEQRMGNQRRLGKFHSKASRKKMSVSHKRRRAEERRRKQLEAWV